MVGNQCVGAWAAPGAGKNLAFPSLSKSLSASFRRDGIESAFSPPGPGEFEVGSVTTRMNIGLSCDLKRNIQK